MLDTSSRPIFSLEGAEVRTRRTKTSKVLGHPPPNSYKTDLDQNFRLLVHLTGLMPFAQSNQSQTHHHSEEDK